MSFRILIVDDEINDRANEISTLPRMLRKAGYEVKTTSDEDEAWNLVWEYSPDLIVLDIHFKDEATYGIEFCREMRETGNETPVILVTAVMKETETVLEGLEAGADDYVKRPQGNREIMARIRANLPPEAIIVDDCIWIDFARHLAAVKRDGDWQEVSLPRGLWRLLEVLVTNAGIPVPPTRIKDRVWDKFVGDGALYKAIHDLRKKLEPDFDNPTYIEAVSGYGYRFNGMLVRANSMLPIGLKARMMAHAEAAIGRLLAEKKRKPDLQPDDLEQLIDAAGQYVMERFTSELVGKRE